MDINKVTDFWRWFASISTELLSHDNNQGLISQLDDRVNRLGATSWEIGPWADGLKFFALSPNLDTNKLKLTRQIIALAPVCKGWHFLPSKPAKEWMGMWNMKNDRGVKIKVDTAAWKYILYQFDDGMFAIDIKLSPIDGSANTIAEAIDIALTGYLGEERFMQLICDVQIVDEFEDAVKHKATSLAFIKDHLQSLS